ncbi:hypothetical protein Belba_0206 [Belliella baltica DSM 15883]|uniref:Uncharacterized protein n=1 Tax=Belliella baltica (strain DSM 15883 / CIP 108006 / LMG 21964 / BA134) TaxID=866536 RepID=I3Z0V6_BELBD|nr:hypothetical protein [Belliella baltica]AFL82874.1 hypothetical protein Belba_0206 [Belliella baltica DSM 15883]
MNRFFITFAALSASGIFTYAYLREWIGIKLFGEEVHLQIDNPEAPYFHSSEDLYLLNILVFGLLFLSIFGLAVYGTWKKKHGLVFLTFVLSMLGMFVVMINGAIK